MAEQQDIATPTAAYMAMEKRWKLVADLLGGTEAMREAREDWLPRNPKESEAAYNLRLGRSFLYPGFAQTIDTWTGKVFGEQNEREAIDISGVGAVNKPFLDNIDLQRSALKVYARDWFYEGLGHGLSYTFVDFPKVPPGATLDDERKLNARPYWVRYSPRQIIGWRSTVVAGVVKLTRVRILEPYTPEGRDDGEGVQQQVRELLPGAWRLWRKSGDKNEWAVADSGVTTLDFIPLVPFYAKRTGFMKAMPPLMELAWKNIEHWQSASEQRNILHVARVPILFGKGFGADEEGEDAGGKANDEVSIGANEMIMVPDENASLEWVEHSGACITSGKEDLDGLKEEMSSLGTQILMAKPGDPTATQESLDTAQSDSNLAGILQGFEDAMNIALDFTARWKGSNEPGRVVVNKQLTVMPTNDDEAEPGAAPAKKPAAKKS